MSDFSLMEIIVISVIVLLFLVFIISIFVDLVINNREMNERKKEQIRERYIKKMSGPDIDINNKKNDIKEQINKFGKDTFGKDILQ